MVKELGLHNKNYYLKDGDKMPLITGAKKYFLFCSPNSLTMAAPKCRFPHCPDCTHQEFHRQCHSFSNFEMNECKSRLVRALTEFFVPAALKPSRICTIIYGTRDIVTCFCPSKAHCRQFHDNSGVS